VKGKMAQILLAEDDDSMREFLAKALTRAGHEVRAVGDGLDALTTLAEERVDILLADVVMPGLDGIELARRAAKEQPGIKVMFITGFAAVALKAREETSRGARVLSKPFHLRELVSQIDVMLSAR
jgi:two-component system cell cycle response regulator CpdR